MKNIYFIQSGQEVKIGISGDVPRRLEELQVGNANKLILRYEIKDVQDIFEGFVHSICQRYYVRGEWFEIGALDHLLKHPFYKEVMVAPNQSKVDLLD